MSISLDATVRTTTGKGAARQARFTGFIPAVMYGPKSDSVCLQIDPEALSRIFQKSRNRNTVVDLKIGDDSIPTLVREVQRHPVSRSILHADFYRVSEDIKVEVMVPITTVGVPMGAVMGGRMRLIHRQVRIRCRYDVIPESFVIDISKMDIDDMVKASEVPTPDGVEMVFDNDFNVLTIYGKKVRAK